jgi:hypothetical protein
MRAPRESEGIAENLKACSVMQHRRHLNPKRLRCARPRTRFLLPLLLPLARIELRRRGAEVARSVTQASRDRSGDGSTSSHAAARAGAAPSIPSAGRG